MDNYSGVLIYGEIDEGRLASVTLELLGIGRELADALGQQLSMVLIEKNAGEYGQEAIAYGADQCVCCRRCPRRRL